MLIHSKPLGDGKGVAPPGHADQQAVGRPQSGHIKLAAAVFHTGGLQSIGFQLRIMSGGGDPHLRGPQGFQNRHCQSRTLYRIGASPQFVDQHQADSLPLHRGQDMNHISHMRGKGR